MNKFIGIGRPTRDPDIRYTTSENPMAVAKFTLAIDRFTNNEEQHADFLSCVAFGKNAEFAEKYLKQGIKIAIEAHVQTGSYTNKDGIKVYTTTFVIDRMEFAESKASANSANGRVEPGSETGEFMNIPDGIEDEGLPFN